MFEFPRPSFRMDQPIDVHYTKLEEWLTDRRAVLAKSHPKEYETCVKAAPRMLQLVKYDIPALRKQLQKLNSQLDESAKVIGGSEKSKQTWRKKRQALLESLGITEGPEGSASHASTVLVISELLDQRIEAASREYSVLVKQQVATAFPLLDELYHSHVAASSEKASGSSRWTALHFPWLQRLFEECHVDDDAGSAPGGASNAAEPPMPAEDAPAIQWDDEPQAISWDDEPPMEVTAVAAVTLQEGLEADALGPAACGGAGTTVQLTRPEHRSAVTEELAAATVFVKERIFDLCGLNIQEAAAFAPQEVATCGALESVRAALSSPQHIDLLRMRSNFRQKERFLQSLESTQRGLSLVVQRTMEHEARLVSAGDEASKCQLELTQLLEEGRHLQEQTERTLSKIFAPRPVSIVGEINKVLQ